MPIIYLNQKVNPATGEFAEWHTEIGPDPTGIGYPPPPTTPTYASLVDPFIATFLGEVEGGTGIISPPAPFSEFCFYVPFSWDTVSPLDIFDVINEDLVVDVSVIMLRPFNDPAGTLSVGDTFDASLFLTTSQIDVSNPDRYVTRDPVQYSGADTLRLTINPATSATGNGVVLGCVRRA